MIYICPFLLWNIQINNWKTDFSKNVMSNSMKFWLISFLIVPAIHVWVHQEAPGWTALQSRVSSSGWWTAVRGRAPKAQSLVRVAPLPHHTNLQRRPSPDQCKSCIWNVSYETTPFCDYEGHVDTDMQNSNTIEILQWKNAKKSWCTYLYYQPGKATGQLTRAEVPCLGSAATWIWPPYHQWLKAVMVKRLKRQLLHCLLKTSSVYKCWHVKLKLIWQLHIAAHKPVITNSCKSSYVQYKRGVQRAWLGWLALWWRWAFMTQHARTCHPPKLWAFPWFLYNNRD